MGTCWSVCVEIFCANSGAMAVVDTQMTYEVASYAQNKHAGGAEFTINMG